MKITKNKKKAMHKVTNACEEFEFNPKVKLKKSTKHTSHQKNL